MALSGGDAAEKRSFAPERLPAAGRWQPWLLATLFLVYASLLLYKAAGASITHDEAFTVTRYLDDPILENIFFGPSYLANNHPLNTLLVRLSVAVFGLSEFAVRLPNVIAGLAFFVLAVRWVRRVLPCFPMFPAAACLLVHQPYLLDYFALGRGYGLGITFGMAALMAMDRQLQSPGAAALSRALALSVLSVLSNYVMLNLHLALSAVALVAILIGWRNRSPIRVLTVWVGFQLLLTLLIARPLAFLATGGELYYGGDKGFWADTVQSLLWQSYYDPERAMASPSIYAGVWMALLGIGLLGLLAAQARRSDGRRSATMAWAILLIAALSTILQHHLAGRPYLLNRTALFFLPLLGWAVMASLRPFQAVLSRVSGQLLVCTMGFFFTVHLLRVYDPATYSEWSFDASTRHAVEILRDSHPEGPVRLGIHWLFEPSVNFYRKSLGLDWPRANRRGPLSADFDFVYLTPREAGLLQGPGWGTVHRFDNGNILARRMDLED